MKEFAAIAKLSAALNLFSEVDKGIRSETISIFLLVAQYPGISPRKLEEWTGTNRSAVNRHLSVLSSDVDWRKQEGLGLIDIKGDTLSRQAYLSAKGRDLAGRILGTLYPNMEIDPLAFTKR